VPEAYERALADGSRLEDHFRHEPQQPRPRFVVRDADIVAGVQEKTEPRGDLRREDGEERQDEDAEDPRLDRAH
jgi:hypothetical protein